LVVSLASLLGLQKDTRHTIDVWAEDLVAVNKLLGGYVDRSSPALTPGGATVVGSGMLPLPARQRCQVYADFAKGSDTNSGTREKPFKTAQKLMNRVRPGRIGCLNPGTFSETDRAINISVGGGSATGGRYTIQSTDPANPAVIAGQLYFKRTSAGYMTLRDVKLNGSTAPLCGSSDTCKRLPSPIIGANNVTLLNNDIYNNGTSICVHPAEAKVSNFRILKNKIHGCGRPGNIHDHGIYVASSSSGVIRGNWIYNNASRGIQFYPDGDGVLVEKNIVHGNGAQNIHLSATGSSTSDNNTIRNNIVTDHGAMDSDHSIDSNLFQSDPGVVFPQQDSPRRNEVYGNCGEGGPHGHIEGVVEQHLAGDPDYFFETNNVTGDIVYENAAAGDFDLANTSDCRNTLRLP
jgi:parallel beta-helix repeat protein